METTRHPAVAGTFYPADPATLATLVDDLLGADPAPPEAPPKAIIVPHAGYRFSGPVAAKVYRHLKPLRGRITRVVLLGPAHRVPVPGLAAPTVRAFETPLGLVPLDRGALERASHLPQVHLTDTPHDLEHSLEVQLPFLQTVLGHFELVPFAVGEATMDEVAGVLDLLWGGEETLIVVSSDLSHYLDYARAREIDTATTEAIESLAPERIGPWQACGRLPVQGLLLEAKRRGLSVQTVDLRSSGDTGGDRKRVVGYGGWVLA